MRERIRATRWSEHHYIRNLIRIEEGVIWYHGVWWQLGWGRLCERYPAEARAIGRELEGGIEITPEVFEEIKLQISREKHECEIEEAHTAAESRWKIDENSRRAYQEWIQRGGRP